VHIHYFRPGEKTYHVAKLGVGDQFTAITGIGPDIAFTVMAIGTDSAEVEIRRGDQPSCGTVRSSSPTQPVTAAPTAAPTSTYRGDLSCGDFFMGSTVGAPSRLGQNSGDAYFSLTVAENDTTIIIESCESDFDTVITLYKGSNVSAINAITDFIKDADDNAGAGECGYRVPAPLEKSWLVHTYQAGSYTILVEGFYEFEGNYVVRTDARCPAPTMAPTPVPTPAPAPVPTRAPVPDCPDGYVDVGVRFNVPLGKISIVYTHEMCAARCTLYSAPQWAGGCKGYQTGMYFGMVFCRSYGGIWQTRQCAPWAHQSSKGDFSGELGSIHPRSGQLNIGGSCCSNSSRL